MNDTLYIVTGFNDGKTTVILGIYPAHNMALERADFAAKVGRWGGIDIHEVKVSAYGADTEITL